jgi:DNA-binding FrmR family transcriptional regulator
MTPEERRLAELEGQVAGLLWLQAEEDKEAFEVWAAEHTWARRWKRLAKRLWRIRGKVRDAVR